MIPSVRVSRRNAVERLLVGRADVARRGRSRAGTRARARRPGSRARRRSSARPRSGRPRPRAPTSARRAARRRGRCRGSPRRPPRRRRARTSASSRKPANMPIAFEPPPTQAITASGRRPSASSTCARASRPITACSSRTISGYGRRADARADQVVRRLDVRDPVADRLARRLLQRPRAELDRHAPRRRAGPSARRSASAGACPRSPCRRRTRARSARRRSPWRRRAGRRRSRRRSACLPSRRASTAWPSALFSLCAPVWSRSSRLR